MITPQNIKAIRVERVCVDGFFVEEVTHPRRIEEIFLEYQAQRPAFGVGSVPQASSTREATLV